MLCRPPAAGIAEFGLGLVSSIKGSERKEENGVGFRVPISNPFYAQKRARYGPFSVAVESKSISIYKKDCLGHATQKERKTARSNKTLLEPGTSQAPSIRQLQSIME